MTDAAIAAQITVKYCNPQQTGKKNASIKTEDGQIYLVSPEMFQQFEQGGRYNIQYKTSTFKGVQYRFIETVTKITPTPPPAHVSTVNSMARASYGHVDMETAERIFVCGALNAMLSNQNTIPFSLMERNLVERVNILRETWRMTFGNPQKSDDLSDEIPFA